MKAEDVQALAKALAPVFRNMLDEQVAVLRGELSDMRANILEAVQRDIAGIEIPQLPELPAMPEIPTAEELVGKLLEAIDLGQVAKDAAALIERPADGTSVTLEDVQPMIQDAVRSAVEALPPAPAGKDADMEAINATLKMLVDGIKLPAAVSAEEVAALFERRFSDLVLSWERQARDAFDKAIDKMPAPKDGRDAFPLSAFSAAVDDDGRTIVLGFEAGELKIEKRLRLPVVQDRGVWEKNGHPDGPYLRGDGVTSSGSFFIAQKDNPEGAPGVSADWRLAVKRGRDGRDLRPTASNFPEGGKVSIK